MENTSERLIKTIADLRRKIYTAKEKLEKEIQVKFTTRPLFIRLHMNANEPLCYYAFQRKKCVEKNLSELRRDISRQKKILSTRRATPLPAIPTSVRKSAFVQ